jgi:hypothetical protein
LVTLCSEIVSLSSVFVPLGGNSIKLVTECINNSVFSVDDRGWKDWIHCSSGNCDGSSRE